MSVRQTCGRARARTRADAAEGPAADGGRAAGAVGPEPPAAGALPAARGGRGGLVWRGGGGG